MRDLILAAIIFGSIPLIFYRPYVGILVLAWLGYMSPHRMTYGFAYDFPFSQVVALATIGAFIISRDKKLPAVSALLVMWGLYFFWTGVTTFFAIYPDIAMEGWTKFFKICLVAFLTVFLVNDKWRVNLLVWVIVASLGFYGLKGGAFTVLTGGSYRVWGPPGSFIESNNALGMALVMTLPFMRYLYLNVEHKYVKYGLLGAMILTAFAVLGTQSRGGFLSLSVMTMYLIMKSRHRVGLGILALVSAVVLFQFMPQSWHERMGTIQNYEEDHSAQGRFNAWNFAYQLAKDRPAVGGGYGSFAEEQYIRLGVDSDYWQGAHSIYFENLGEHGFVGVGIFLLFLFTIFRTASSISKRASQYEDMLWARDLAAMLQVSMVGFCVSGLFIELSSFDLVYSIVAILIVLHTLVKKRAMRGADVIDDNRESGFAGSEPPKRAVIGV